MCRSNRRRALSGVLPVLFAAGSAASARAQAWLPPKGEASFFLGYGDVFVTKHYLGTSANPGDNVENDFGHIRSHNFEIELEYGLADRLAISAALPYVISKYYGTPGQNFFPHDISVDDGNYHGTFQDYKFSLNYQAFRGPVAVAPFVAAVIPSHDYVYFAHTAPGRRLHEYIVGSSFGAQLDSVLPGSYAELTYSYAFVEEVLGIHHDRSNGFLELGYYVTPSLSVRAIGTAFYTHGGLVFKTADVLPPPEIFEHHDQIGHDSGISAGGGFTYQLSGSTEVYLAYLTQLQGRGGHKIDDSWSLGFSYSFSPAQIVRRLFSSGHASSETP